MSFYDGKTVLVTGGTGMIGQPLVKLLQAAGASVRVASLDNASRAPEGAEVVRCDLREFSNCVKVCAGIELVFHLAGVKGSPAMTARRPASFFVPTLSFGLNMMEAARRAGVERYLLTSSVGVYAPAEVLEEDSVWETRPSPNDRFAGWAKRMCELQADAYRIEYGWDGVSIVRPANVYGPFDNFDTANAMVIPSLIRKALEADGELDVWGDGSPVRDFIFAGDVARGMMFAVENGITEPLNLGSGAGATIREAAEIVAANIGKPLTLKWDVSKPAGDKRRIMDTRRAESHGFKPQVSLEDGIKQTIAWYRDNARLADERYNPFTDPDLVPAAEGRGLVR